MVCGEGVVWGGHPHPPLSLQNHPNVLFLGAFFTKVETVLCAHLLFLSLSLSLSLSLCAKVGVRARTHRKREDWCAQQKTKKHTLFHVYSSPPTDAPLTPGDGDLDRRGDPSSAVGRSGTRPARSPLSKPAGGGPVSHGWRRASAAVARRSGDQSSMGSRKSARAAACVCVWGGKVRGVG